MNEPTLHLTEDAWRDQFEERNIFCNNLGDPELPHPVALDGYHMSGSFAGEYVWESSQFFTEISGYLVRNYQNIIPYNRVDRIVGIGESASILAYKISESVFRWENRDCLATFCTEKAIQCLPLVKDRYPYHEKRMVFPILPVQKNERVLIVTNGIHTGYRIPNAVRAIESEGGTVLPYLVTLWNGMGQKEIHGRTICSLFSETIIRASPSECALCQMGSTPIPHASFMKAWRASRRPRIRTAMQ